MTNPWWLSLLTAGIGAGSALLGGWLTHLFTTKRDSQQFDRLTRRQDDEWRRQREDKVRDIRAQLYLDVMGFLENTREMLNVGEMIGDVEREHILGLSVPDQLTAKVNLYGDDELRTGWRQLLNARGAVVFSVREQGMVAPESADALGVCLDGLQGLLRERALSAGSQLDFRVHESRRDGGVSRRLSWRFRQ